MITAFAAGLASFLSPCVLPLATGYIVYITGAIFEEDLSDRKFFALKRTIGFVLGFTIVFVLMGITASSIGIILNTYRRVLLKIGGAVLIAIGLSLLGLFKLNITGIHKKMPDDVGSFTSSFLVGMIFAIGWTPCVGAILGAILIYAGSQGTALHGGLLLFIYSLGFSLPFIITALFVDRIDGFWRKLMKYQKAVSRIMGIIIIILGFMMLTDRFSILS